MSIKLVDDVEKMLGMFEMKATDLSSMNVSEKREFENKILAQYQPVCQGHLNTDYLIDALEKANHVITLNVNGLVIGMAILREQYSKMKYMEVDVICAREHSHVGSLILNACENLARSMKIGAVSLSSVPTAIGFYRKMGYGTVPKSRICDETRFIDHEILTIYDNAKNLIEIQTEKYAGGSGESDSPSKTLLVNLGIEPEQYVSLAAEFTDHVEMWDSILKDIDVDDLFDDGNIIMTKCLFNPSQKDIGVIDINVSQKRQRNS